jgi:Glucosamine-6-phosphate isomerases/6-phosphogluconolactonase
MNNEIYADADALARQAAKLIAKEAGEAVAARGRFVMAVSAGKTPWLMLRDLASEDVSGRACMSSRWTKELRLKAGDVSIFVWLAGSSGPWRPGTLSKPFSPIAIRDLRVAPRFRLNRDQIELLPF